MNDYDYGPMVMIGYGFRKSYQCACLLLHVEIKLLYFFEESLILHDVFCKLLKKCSFLVDLAYLIKGFQFDYVFFSFRSPTLSRLCDGIGYSYSPWV